MTVATTRWTAPVRYAEVDGQGVVFNAHYLLWCDEAMSLFCRERRLADLAERVQLKASSLTWSSGARWGEHVSVTVVCTHIGRTSFRIAFAITADGRASCDVVTTYVLTDAEGTATPLSADQRERLSA